MRSLVLVPLALSAISLVACVKEDERRGTTTLTNATVALGALVRQRRVRRQRWPELRRDVAHGALGRAPHRQRGPRPGRISAHRADPERPGRDAAQDRQGLRRPEPADFTREFAIVRRSAAASDRGARSSRKKSALCNSIRPRAASRRRPGARRGSTRPSSRTCLGAVRQLSCTGENQTLQNLPACRSICNP